MCENLAKYVKLGKTYLVAAVKTFGPSMILIAFLVGLFCTSYKPISKDLNNSEMLSILCLVGVLVSGVLVWGGAITEMTAEINAKNTGNQ